MQEMQEMWVRFLSWEDPLEEEMATHSSILAWKIPWTEESGGLQFMGSQRGGHDWSDNTHTILFHDKNVQKGRNRREFLNMVKCVYEKFTFY